MCPTCLPYTALPLVFEPLPALQTAAQDVQPRHADILLKNSGDRGPLGQRQLKHREDGPAICEFDRRWLKLKGFVQRFGPVMLKA